MENKHPYAIRGITEKHISCKNQILITSSVHDHLLNSQNSNMWHMTSKAVYEAVLIAVFGV